MVIWQIPADSERLTASERRATMDRVPRISQFYGIAIYMYFSDHPPPHIHAQYGGVEAVIAIGDGGVIRGSIPDRALRLVREWLELHREEVEANWRLASRPAPLNAIDPLP